MRKTRIAVAVLIAYSVVFAASLSLADEISQVRAAITAKQARWQAGETSMTRLSPEQRQARLGLIKPTGITGLPAGTEVAGDGPTVSAVPSAFDWRNVGEQSFVTPVRSQGGCGSCWAFASTAALESSALRSNNTPGVNLNLSEQVLVSCGSSGGADAGSCGGGYIEYASDYIRNTGLPLETCYPYTATDGSCGSACSTYQSSTYQIVSWAYVTTTSPTVSTIRTALLNYGPLVTTMEVYSDFDAYVSGIYTHTSGTDRGGHAVLIVGYSDSGQYFIVKNSWGTDWGESGYFRIAYSEISSLVGFGEWTIAYTGTACSYLITPSSQSFTSADGSRTVDVWTQSSCAWSAQSNVAWVTTSSSSTGGGSASFSVQANSGAKARTGTLTVAGRTHTVTQAGTPPTITNRSPASDAAGVSVDTAITVDFSETMNASSIHASSFRLRQGGTIVAGSVNPGSLNATFTPSSRLAPGTTYTVTVTTAVQDDEGVALASPVSWNFTTLSPAVSSGSGSGGGCFIATAAFGSALEPRVVTLRQFRDVYLMPSHSGRAFVEIYYLFSPSVADVIAGDEGLKNGARAVLAPVVAASETLLGTGREPSGLIGWLGAAVILCCGARRGSRRDNMPPR